MAEQTMDSQGQWRGWSDWPFTHIFRSFRMAISPGKLALAFLGVLALTIWGSFLDGIWPQSQQAMTGELAAYWQNPDFPTWREQTAEAQASRLRVAWAQMGAQPPADLRERYLADPNGEVDRAMNELHHRYDSSQRGQKPEIAAEAARNYSERFAELATLYRQPIFWSFVDYEGNVLRHMVDAAGSLNFTGRLNDILGGRNQRIPLAAAAAGMEGVGVLPDLILAARGVQWLLSRHFIFAVLLGLGALAIWSLFGGAISRMAALDVARDERISMGSAVNFARRKYLGFFTAPLLPLALVVLIGVCIFLYGWMLAIPYIGELLGGLLLILPLVGGFILALVIIGAIAGGSLFYPTIAVEGSDSFDAMSRSYSYIYSKPWRALWYGLVALLYGALCYFFVRFFALLMLKSARFFLWLGTWLWGTQRPGAGRPWATKVDAMWPNPSFTDFWPGRSPFGPIHWEAAGSLLIWIWVALVSVLVAAFLVSFFYSVSTVIYYLLRRAVDATDLEEAYVDEEPEGEAEAALPGAAPASEMGPAATAAEETTPPPPAEPPVGPANV